MYVYIYIYTCIYIYIHVYIYTYVLVIICFKETCEQKHALLSNAFMFQNKLIDFSLGYPILWEQLIPFQHPA